MKYRLRNQCLVHIAIAENKLLLGRKDGLIAIDFKPYLTKK